MLMVPFKVSEQEYSIFVVLEDENLARMKAHDPAQINFWKIGAPWETMRVRDVIIATPGSEDTAKAMKMIQQGNAGAAMAYLSRGFSFKPKEGDNDTPYEPTRGLH